jgi:predicted nucleic acid-binding protein
LNFFDTNVLVYAVTDNDERCAQAIKVLGEGGVTSAQVLSELTNTLIRKLKVRWRDVEDALDNIKAVVSDVRPLTLEIHAVAVSIARDHKIQWFDALVVSSALEAGCDRLLTEDLQHGRKFGPLRIVNPFI